MVRTAISRALLALGLLVGLALPASADYASTRAKLEEGLKTSLEEAAAWSHKKKVYAQRDQAYRMLILVEPDHKKARKYLQFKKQKDGSWLQKKSYRTPGDKGDETAAEADAMIATAFDAYASGVVDAIESEKSFSSKDRREAAQALLEFSPDYEPARELLGEVRSENGESWILVESQRAAKRRKDLLTLAVKTIDEAPEATDSPPTGPEQNLAVTFLGGIQNDALRVLVSTSTGEAQKVAAALRAAPIYWKSAVGTEQPLPDGYLVYLLQESDRDPFIDNFPQLTPEDIVSLKRLTSSNMGGPRLGSWAEDERFRMDGLVRLTVYNLFRAKFPKSANQGWVGEGLGFYLSFGLVGTKLTPFFDASAGGSVGDDVTYDPEGDWIAEARALMQSPRPPRLAFLLGKGINIMGTRDVYHAYALAAYLVEGHPGSVARILAEIEKGADAGKAFEKVLGWDLPHLDERLTRWLEEIAAA